MNVIVKGKNIQVTPSLKEYAEKRFSKLDKYFTTELEATVTLIVERELHRVEATIPLNGYLLRAEEQTSDMYASIDSVTDKIERQIRKYKTRVNRKSKTVHFTNLSPSIEIPVAEESQEGKIVKVKHFAVKPIDEEEAILQMELLGHNFYVFLNSTTNNVNVVYKRNDGAYGLIEPELG